ncbi:MAG: hypothetical protein KAI51_04465, partial [Candidatus Aenigmarchaeota archaeon]|nr:hypothetical protein [Candidatus Aenigmarchaeota archaeon]
IKDMVVSDSSNSVISDEDGVKFDVSGIVCFVRPSGTSPVVRVVVEGRDEKETKEIFDNLVSRIDGL